MKKKYFMRMIFACIIFWTSFASAQLQVGENLASFDDERRVSLDLKGMDVIEVLKILAQKGEMNVVVGNNVRGRVTMFLKDVDVQEAFELILAANNLASDKRGEVVYVMTERDYEQLYGKPYADKKETKTVQLKYAKASEVAKALNQIKTKIGKVIADEGSNTIVIVDAPEALSDAMEFVGKIDKPTSTMVFELNYAKAEDLKDKIKEILTEGVGALQIDERTNKILVTDLKDRMGEIEQVIRAFDAKSQQVLIDAKIIEITLSDAYKLGVDWQAVFDDIQKRLYPVIKNRIGAASAFKLAASGGLIPGAELIIGAFGAGDYSIMIQALKSVGDVNTLSNPRITVMNNEEAKILIGTSKPYATNTVTQSGNVATTGTQLAFIEIGVKLYVTPTINRDGFVSMKIKPEVSDSTSDYTYGNPATTVPVVSTTQAETSVMVKDGNTIIIAGLIKDYRSGLVKKIPLLGDIPLLGTLFKNTDNSVQKKELVIFLTPHIISGETDYLEVPKLPPLEEEKFFTVKEDPTFIRRKPVELAPDYMREGLPKKARLEDNKIRASNEEEYFYLIKNRILDNLSVTENDPNIKKGDKVKVYFRLYSGGNLAAKPKAAETTNSYFGEKVIQAVERSAPFPAFPITIKEFKKDFSLDIVYDPNL